MFLGTNVVEIDGFRVVCGEGFLVVLMLLNDGLDCALGGDLFVVVFNAGGGVGGGVAFVVELVVVVLGVVEVVVDVVVEGNGG